MTRATFEEITTDQPHKPLTEKLVRRAGRNSQGKLTVRHQGSGHKRLYRVIDWKRDKAGVPARIATVEYDPNRSARIGLLHYADGEKRYMLLPHGLGVGDTVISGADVEARTGNALPLSRIPLGTQVHNIELVGGPRRPDRAQRRQQRPAAGQGGWHGHHPAAVRRGAPRARRVHGHRRAGEQPGPREPEASARPDGRATWAAARRCAAW